MNTELMNTTNLASAQGAYDRQTPELEYAADRTEVLSVLAGRMDKTISGKDFEDMWTADPMWLFFDGVNTDYEASRELFALAAKHPDDCPALTGLVKKLADALAEELR